MCRKERSMKPRYIFTSLTCISDLPEVPFSVEPLPRREWETGDYVVGEVASPRTGSPL
jgi:hypothetical protein